MARPTEDEEEIIAPKKPRARQAHVISIDGEAEVKPKPRTRKPKVFVSETTIESESIRKAPTPMAAARIRKTKTARTGFTVLVGCVLLAGGGIGVGLLDTGPINVVAVVNERNEKINRGEVRDEKTGETLTQTVQVQSADARPNGGLQIADPVEPLPVSVPSADASSTTATSSDQGTVSSTSEEVVETSTTTPAETETTS